MYNNQSSTIGHSQLAPMSIYMGEILKKCSSDCKIALVADHANQHENATELSRICIKVCAENESTAQNIPRLDQRPDENQLKGHNEDNNNISRPVLRTTQPSRSQAKSKRTKKTGGPRSTPYTPKQSLSFDKADFEQTFTASLSSRRGRSKASTTAGRAA